MLNRRRRLLLVALVGLALAGGVWWAWVQSTAVTARYAGRIIKGLTPQQVQAIFRRPPDDFFLMNGLPPAKVNYVCVWYFYDGYIEVSFDVSNGVVNQSVHSEAILPRQFRRLLDKFGY